MSLILHDKGPSKARMREQAGDVRNVMTKSMNAGARRRASDTIWHESGETDGDGPMPAARPLRSDSGRVERIATLVPPPVAGPGAGTVSPGPTGGAMLHRFSRLLDGLIAFHSLASTDPVLDVRDFPWTAGLRREWAAIRAEAVAMAPSGLMPLWQDGGAVAVRAAGCPRTLAALRAIPGLYDAAFASLAPDAHIPARRGATKGLITCHLGLVVPRDGGARMRVRDRILRWAEGETLIFDDSFDHEIHNDAAGQRIVLRIRFARPLRQPGQWVAEAVLRLLRGRI